MNIVNPQSMPMCPLAAENVTFDKTDEFDHPINNSDVLVKLSDHMCNLSDHQLCDLSELFDNYPNVIKDIPGLCTVMKHDVILIDGATPIKQLPYRLSPQKRLRMKEAVKYLLENDLAEPCFSPWSSPCLLAPKPDGTDRLCTDFRRVNQITVVDSCPLPRLDDLVDSVE